MGDFDGCFCDWLTVTYSPENCPDPEVQDLVYSVGGVQVNSPKDGRKCYRVGGSWGDDFSKWPGTIVVDHGNGWVRIDFSGMALKHFRTASEYGNLLALLSTSPHKVTRLDATLDVPADAADVIKEFVDRHPTGFAAIRRKKLKIMSTIGVRDDMRKSGTVYLGHRTRARVTAKVYDKQLEALEKRGLLLPPTTRYEITLRDGTCTLRDASDCGPVFWHHAVPVFFPVVPDGVVAWESFGDMVGWKYQKRERLPMRQARKIIEEGSEVRMLVSLAEDLGLHGRTLILRMIANQLGCSDEEFAGVVGSTPETPGHSLSGESQLDKSRKALN